MSERAYVAERILEWCENHGANFFGEERPRQSDDKRCYQFLIGVPRSLDGFVRVYSPQFIHIQMQGPMAPQGSWAGVYTSEEDAIAFIKAVIDWNTTEAQSIPTKERK